ncbi:aminoglycoside adenylyltransferase domain-containing protein [Pseudobutyrivibrio xylanivorans]|uniref:inorganic diphosphatase n=1 Tax=Pseudobutyrivibrio xylanivorans TaxID=185007 RepID=A0A5P6VQT9_PSEXY|nr:aminoglycoside adenylyltransferase domain-containing protein [Pseudobutyrivibrio xylanivorans]QFJ53524.1 DUF4111 domain-containing protein [Pseudobutyrivibrio xylanivorans]
MEKLLDNFVENAKEILKDNLVGIYLHGSAVMGCFNPDKSDLDLIVVVKGSIEDPVKKQFMDMVVKLNKLGPAKGIEMSIVSRNVCKPFVYPTPFDLHFSIGTLDWYKSNPNDYIQKMKGTDKDLAAHFTIITNRGKCLYGLSIDEAFAPVPKEDYLDSIWEDIVDAKDDILENTMYIVLNLARVLAYKKEGLVLSKKEGGEWALNHIPTEFHTLILAALDEYIHNEAVTYDETLAQKYSAYMLEEIQKSCEIIGTTVKGHIDRPLGSTHPNYPGMIYPINYGYVDGVFAADGEEQDVYVFGTNEPLKIFEGKVIAVYHRTNDNEDKWIVSLDGTDYSDEDILSAIEFQEQYFEGELLR